MTRARDNSFNPFNNNYAGKNLIINGGFDIWQRGTSLTGITAANVFLADRWSTGTAGAYNIYLSRQLTNDTTNLPNIQYCLRYGRTAGNTNGNWNTLNTSLETINSIPLAGKTITLSFYARAGANFSSTGNGLASFIMSGTGTDQNLTLAYTGGIYSYGGHTLTSAWQRFTNTYTVPTNATEIAVSFQYVPTGTAGANDYYEITGVQLELGSTPTTFSRAGGDIQGELVKCQRYYWRSGFANDSIDYNKHSLGYAQNTTSLWCQMLYPQTMRVAPSIESSTLSSSASTIGIYDSVSNFHVSSLSIDRSTTRSCNFNANTTGLTAYRPGQLQNFNNTNGFIGFSAEL